tara:strand:+ start:124 stop:423 length:300 start_codon:yes stop_codon:yes gene_type:complete
MIEATKRPWKRDKYGYMTADGGNLYVAHGVTVPNGEHHPRYAEAFANEELILKAVNSHDALVEALDNFVTWIDSPDIEWGGVPETPELVALRAALEQVK